MAGSWDSGGMSGENPWNFIYPKPQVYCRHKWGVGEHF